MLTKAAAERDPAAIRRRALARVMERTRATVAQFHRLVRAGDDGTLYLGSTCVLGPPGVVDALSRLEGAPVQAFEYDLAHAPPYNAFGLHRIDEVPPRIRETWWERLGFADALAANLARSDRLVGVVFLYRLAGEPPFGQTELDAGNGMIRWLRLQLDEAEDLERAGPVLEGSWVVDLHGRIRYAPAGRPRELHTDALARAARDFLARGGTSERVLDGHLLRMLRLDADDGPAVLVHATAARSVTADGVLRLTPLKRRIAWLAAQGSTVPEIARSLDRSPETVRTHLKKIYEQLGVNSRIELADACRTPWR